MVPVSRADALNAAFYAAQPMLPQEWTAADFVLAVSDWECHPVVVAGDLAGAVLTNGPEIHACVAPEFHGRWMSKRTLRILSGILQQYGYAVTRAATDAGKYFVNRLGFSPTDQAGVFLKELARGH